jgi:hypothetical protein
VAVVARILPRHWDGHRLLQFLTGLALIALSFAVRVDGPTATPATVSAAPAAAVVGAVHTEPAEVDSDQAVRRPTATGPADVTLPAAAVAPVTTAPVGDIPPAYGSRAPPAA